MCSKATKFRIFSLGEFYMLKAILRNNKALCITSRLFIGFTALQLAAFAASTTPVVPAVAAEPAGRQAAEMVTVSSGEIGKVADVTDYYIRPEKMNFRSGRGLAFFETENFVGSSRCAFCHDLLRDSVGNDMSISNHWRSTMMANAAKDPLWQAKVSSEVKRNPALKEVIETKCSTCHMPIAWTQAYKNGGDRLVLDEGFLNTRNSLHSAAMEGVSCSLCHQIQDRNLGQQESFNGKFVIDVSKNPPDREIFGPYREPLQAPMRQSVGFTPGYGPHINDSALCATCHTLYTPFVDSQGNVVGEFPEQTPYLEWKYSDYGVNAASRYDIGENPGQGKICQECHMPHSENGPVNIARWAPPSVKPKDHFSQHYFVGGNVFMLDVLQDNVDNLGLSASTGKFEDTKERTMRQLQSETAGLTLVGLDKRGSQITLDIKINNKVGHKFPSGIPTRRTWIHLQVTDGSGEIVFESGKPLADGRIEGNDADSGSVLGYEDHYDEINDPGQVQIYEGIMLNTDNEVTYTLLRAAKYAKDNRLLPRGFDKAGVPADIGVFGRALTDEDFIGGSDQVTYRIDTANHQGPFTITARLLFTTVSNSFIRDLAADQDLHEVNRFISLYNKAEKTPQEVAAIRFTTQ